MAEMTYKGQCIEYLKHNLECVGYRDFIIEQLNKLEQIENIVDAYATDNPREPMYDTEDYMESIKGVLEE
jgi:hypothetical protein